MSTVTVLQQDPFLLFYQLDESQLNYQILIIILIYGQNNMNNLSLSYISIAFHCIQGWKAHFYIDFTVLCKILPKWISMGEKMVLQGKRKNS